MEKEFNFESDADRKAQEEEKRWREIMLNEILYEWPEEVRIEQYTLLVGQKPKTYMTDQHIAESIIEPENERLRILTENREEDKGETTTTYRK